MLYLHGVPSNSDDWIAWLALTGGLAVDLPGFGRSGKPGSLSYTIEEYDAFIERFLDWRGIERVRLVMHDWGAVGLAFAQRRPERVERMVLINVVPFLPGYRWHRTARVWRTPGLGELAMGATVGFTLKRLSREANVTPGPLPEDLAQLDHRPLRPGHRAGDPAPVPELPAGARWRPRARTWAMCEAPTLVAWGTRTPTSPSASPASTPHALRRRRAARAPRRRPLAVARPPRPARARARVPGPRMSGDRPRRAASAALAAAGVGGPAAAPAGRARRLDRPPAWLLAAAMAVGYLILAPSSPDLAAASYRSDLFSRVGFTLWDNSWYGGHHLPAYSLLAPPLGALVGPRLLAALAVVAQAVLFERLLARRRRARRAAWRRCGSRSAPASRCSRAACPTTSASPRTGRRCCWPPRARALALVLCVLCSLASPVAGAFLALALVAWAIAGSRRAPWRWG